MRGAKSAHFPPPIKVINLHDVYGLRYHLYCVCRTNDVDCLAQLATLVEKSSVSNEAVQFDDENGWVWRDWKGFLSQHFLAVKGIRSYQHFRYYYDSHEHSHVKIKLPPKYMG